MVDPDLKKVRIEDRLTNARFSVFLKLIKEPKVEYVSTRGGHLVVRLKSVDANGAPIDNGPRREPVVLRRLDQVSSLGIYSEEETQEILEEAFQLDR